MDGKAGNQDYVQIHGRLGKAGYDEMDNLLELKDAPWDEIDELTDGENNDIK